MKAQEHKPITLKLELTYTFNPVDSLPDDWEGTRAELVEWFRCDLAESLGEINTNEIFNNIEEIK